MLKVLILEDVREDKELMLRHLKRNFKLTHQWVENESDYRKVLSDFKPDIVLSDYSLPQFDGMQALKIRNQEAPLTPFIVVTGSINEQTAVECIKSGATDYVMKEHLDRLHVAVRNALEQKKTREKKELAQKQLVESLERFRKFVENDISGDYIEDEHEVIFCNRRILEIFDFESIEELNTYGTKNLHVSQAKHDEIIDAIKKNGYVKDYEIPMKTSKGKPLVILENAFGEFDESGNLIQIQGYLIDITERRKAEDELKKSENLFRGLSENMAAGLVIYNEEGFLFVNPAATQIAEFTEKEMLGMKFWEVVHPDHRELIKIQGMQRLKNKEVQKNYNFKLLTKTGKTRWINLTAGHIEFKGKQAAIGTVFDITRLKTAEFEIKKLSTVVKQAPLIIVITDIDGNIEYVNQAFINTTGYTLKEVKGQNPRILQSGKTPKEVYPRLWDTIISGKTWVGEFINKKKSGQEYIEYAVISPVMDGQGNILRYAAIKEDITHRKQMEAEVLRSKKIAEEANRLKSAFLANMSHELRTPLNGILGFSELMMDAETVEETREMNHFIYESGQRLLRTLRLILDISRLEAGSFQPNYQPVEILPVVQKVIQLFQGEIDTTNLQIRNSCSIEHYSIETDEKFLSDTLEHLIDNAIKYTPEGSVTISINKKTENEIPYAVIDITDTGIGISKENQKTIFEDFRQESEGYGRTYEGIGLGLSLAKKYVELMNGFIRLKSKVNVGSTFSVYIPESPMQENKSNAK